MDKEMYQEYYNQGEVLLSAGKAAEALGYFQKAEAADPRHTELYISMGIVYANQDRLDEAEKTFRKALYVDKKCGEAYFHLGCIAGLKGDLAQAVVNINTAQANGYTNAQVLYTLGMVYEEQGEVNMALRSYNKALGMEAVRADVHLQKCNLLLKEGRREEAVAALGEMIVNCPDYYEGYHLKCSVLCELGRYEEAGQVLQQGLELFPAEVGFKVDQAKILTVQERYEEAERLLKALEQEDGGEWKRAILMEEARIAGMQNDAPKTEAALERAYRECREEGGPDEEICYLLMSVYMTEKKYAQVMPLAKELTELSENSTYVNIAHFYYAESLKESGNMEAAKPAFEDTIKRCRAAVLENPGAVDAYMIRALSLNRLGENEKALELIDFVLELAPESPEIHSAKALILRDMDRSEEYQREIEKINELGGQLSEVMSML